MNKELQEGAKAIHTWQKLIHITDRLELGWQVVEAYESDELASDNEDAKRLEKAQKCMEQKDMKNKRKRILMQRDSRSTYRWCGQSIAPGGVNQHSSQRNFNPIQTSLVPSQGGGPSQRPMQPGLCFHCLGPLEGKLPLDNQTVSFELYISK